MGGVGARLLGHIRRCLCGIGAALVVVALVLAGPLEQWERLWFDQLFELPGVRPPTTRELVSMPLPVIRRGAAAVEPLTMVPDADGHVRRVPVRVLVPDALKGHEWWLAFAAQLHRQVGAAGFPTRPLPAADGILVN